MQACGTQTSSFSLSPLVRPSIITMVISARRGEEKNEQRILVLLVVGRKRDLGRLPAKEVSNARKPFFHSPLFISTPRSSDPPPDGCCTLVVSNLQQERHTCNCWRKTCLGQVSEMVSHPQSHPLTARVLRNVIDHYIPSQMRLLPRLLLVRSKGARQVQQVFLDRRNSR
jgi:hypothetical protein